MKNSKKILITGGAGFLGSHLAEKAVKEGHKVIVVDNLYTGNLEKISFLFPTQSLQFIQQDIQEPLDFDVDWIFHLACPASPPHYQKDPIQTLKTSFFGMLNVLDLAEKRKARVLFSSTSEVYGDPKEHPQKESYFGNVNPNGIRACYDEGKRAAECLCMDYFRQKKLDVRIARIFNTYGPKMNVDDGRVVSNFICQALKKEPITLYGTGDQTRSFCYVDDLVQGLWEYMQAPSFPGPINFGNPNEFTILELAELVLEFTKSSSSLTFLPLPQDDPVRRMPDISLAHEKLNWSPKIQLAEGLLKTIPHFEKQLQVRKF